MRFIINFLVSFSHPSTYTALFKGFITLSTLFLISTQQVITVTIPIEQSAYEEKVSYEAVTGTTVSSFNKMKCDIKEKGYSHCAMAKYKGELSGNLIDMLIQFHNLIMIISGLIGILCVISFTSSLLLSNQANKSNK